MALATLALGVLLMMGGAGLAQVHVTFLNFIALPITFGIGAEYALNVVTRYREERNVSRAVISTGAAVALCSWTTIVGYGSLLAATNQALNGFGLMAIIGEVVCLVGCDRRPPRLAVLAPRPAVRGSAAHRERRRPRATVGLPQRPRRPADVGDESALRAAQSSRERGMRLPERQSSRPAARTRSAFPAEDAGGRGDEERAHHDEDDAHDPVAATDLRAIGRVLRHLAIGVPTPEDDRAQPRRTRSASCPSRRRRGAGA